MLARMGLVERRSLTDEHERVPVDVGNVPENVEGLVAENPARLQAVVAELRESEERYRAVVEQAAEGILLVDVDSKRVLEANTAYQNLLGYSPEEVLRLSLYDLVPYPPRAWIATSSGSESRGATPAASGATAARTARWSTSRSART